MTSQGLHGLALLQARVVLPCPSCASEFQVPARYLIASPIACTRCQSPLDLTRADRLALWNSYIRSSALPAEATASIWRPPRR